MSDIPSPSAPSGDERGDGLVPVWDLLVRLFHWSLVVLFFAAFFTEKDLLFLHVWAGYGVAVLVAARILWGLFGSQYARFVDFLYRPSQVFAYLRDLVALTAKRYIGHSPAGGAMVAALLVCLVAISASGILLYGLEDGAGPLAHLKGVGGRQFRHLIEGFHEVLANLTLALIVVHVGGVLLASFAHHENLVRAMITGRKRAGP